MSLLCVPFKILERLIYLRVEPIIDPLLPLEPAGFQHRMSTVDQVTLLTQDIGDSFSAKKVGAVFVNLTAAYDTVWQCIGVRGGGAAAPSGLKNFRATSVFRASTICSKIPNDKRYLNTVKISRATLFSGQAQVAQKSCM